jgi:hypothetical protein
MDYPRDMLSAAHRHSSRNRAELLQSQVCGCFYCCETFAPTAITRWLEVEDTALCPLCTVDSVIGSDSGFPVADQSFLSAMHDRWFG